MDDGRGWDGGGFAEWEAPVRERGRAGGASGRSRCGAESSFGPAGRQRTNPGGGEGRALPASAPVRRSGRRGETLSGPDGVRPEAAAGVHWENE